jgi:hypothetical protein
MGVLKQKKKVTVRHAARPEDSQPEPLFSTEILLSERAYDQLLKEMESSTPPNETLRQAAAWYKQIHSQNGELQIPLEPAGGGEHHS